MITINQNACVFLKEREFMLNNIKCMGLDTPNVTKIIMESTIEEAHEQWEYSKIVYDTLNELEKEARKNKAKSR